jgi:hypothetical protein
LWQSQYATAGYSYYRGDGLAFEGYTADDQEAESAAKRLVEANLAMVISVAEGYQACGIHILDLVQKGNDALLIALKTLPREHRECDSRFTRKPASSTPLRESLRRNRIQNSSFGAN